MVTPKQQARETVDLEKDTAVPFDTPKNDIKHKDSSVPKLTEKQKPPITDGSAPKLIFYAQRKHILS